MFLRDIEKIARAMHAQHVEIEYIRHYLMDTYQLGAAQVDGVLKRIDLVKSDRIVGKKKTVGPEKRGTYY